MCQEKRVATRGSGWRSAGTLHTDTTHADPFILPGCPRATTTQQSPPKRRVTKHTRSALVGHACHKNIAREIPSIQPHPLPPKNALLSPDKTPTRFLGQPLLPSSNNPHSLLQTTPIPFLQQCPSPFSNNAHTLPPNLRPLSPEQPQPRKTPYELPYTLVVENKPRNSLKNLG